MIKTPKCRDKNMLVQSLGDELMLYDLEKDTAYCLNKTSAKVWQLCDGSRSIKQISQTMSDELQSPVTEDLVLLALDGFDQDGLLAEKNELSGKMIGMSRRELVRKAGLATMIALPLIVNITAPKAIHAQSGECNVPADCPSEEAICVAVTCISNVCGIENRPAGFCIALNLGCDGNGNTTPNPSCT